MCTFHFCDCPRELLVCIVIFVRNRSVFWRANMENGTPSIINDRKWAYVMLVCTHLRAATREGWRTGALGEYCRPALFTESSVKVPAWGTKQGAEAC
jgi:hypothetical protein